MNVISGSLAVFALVIGVWLFWWKNLPKVTILLFLIAGLGLGGWLGALAGRALTLMIGLMDSTVGRAIGVGGGAIVAAVAVVMTLEVVWKGLWFRKASPKRYHPWLALALPTVAVAAGLPFLNTLFDAFSNAVSSVGNGIG